MKRVVIIGAGPAGLTAAYELVKQSSDFEVIVLEESQVCGGISRTIEVNGNRMDIGGHRFFSKDLKVMEWWQSFMPLQGQPSWDEKQMGQTESHLRSDGPNPEEEDCVFLQRNRVSRIYYGGHFFDYPISLNVQTIQNMGFFTTFRAGCSYLYSTTRPLPETNLENFYINRFGRVLYSMFFEGYTEKLWGRHPREIAPDWGAQRVKGLSIQAVLADFITKKRKKSYEHVETSLIETFYYPKLGPGQLWTTVAEEVQTLGGKIIFGAKVVSILSEEQSISKIIYEHDGEKLELSVDYLLSSMSVKDLLNSWEGLKENNSHVYELGSNLPYRDFITVGIEVPRLLLKNETSKQTVNNIIPDCWIYIQEPSIKMGRMQIFNNWSPYLVQNKEENVWIGLEYFCDEDDSFWSLSNDETISFAIHELEEMGIIKGEEVIHTHVERVKKAYPAYFDSYASFEEIRTFLDRFTNLFCIGRNGQHRYNNMDHSMVTAFEAVNSIISGSNNKDTVWSVNTEKSFHEEK